MAARASRFGVVGLGWRAQYFLKLAAQLPAEVEVVGLVGRDPAKTEQAAARWKAPAYGSLSDLVSAQHPDFVICAVPWPVNPGVIRAAVELKVPVICETPPAPDLAGLRSLWDAVGASGLVQVSEQYPLMPSHASRLALARSGAIGTVTSVQVSSTHLYHAVALMRAFLAPGFGPATVNARIFVAPLLNPLVRDAWTDDDSPKDAQTLIATIDWGDSMGLYDFTDNQWHNQLRMRRIVVRGSAGEIANDEVVRLTGPRTIVRSPLVRRQTGYDLDLDGFDTDHISLGDTILYRNPFIGLRLSDEEIAIATLLLQMAAWRRDEGAPPYRLADGCQDLAVALAVEQAAETGETITTAREPGPPLGRTKQRRRPAVRSAPRAKTQQPAACAAGCVSVRSDERSGGDADRARLAGRAGRPRRGAAALRGPVDHRRGQLCRLRGGEVRIGARQRRRHGVDQIGLADALRRCDGRQALAVLERRRQVARGHAECLSGGIHGRRDGMVTVMAVVTLGRTGRACALDRAVRVRGLRAAGRGRSGRDCGRNLGRLVDRDRRVGLFDRGRHRGDQRVLGDALR